MLLMRIETGLSLWISSWKVDVLLAYTEGTAMQIEKALTIDRLHVSKVSWKFYMPTIYNFVVICPWNLLFSYKIAYFLIILIVFLVFVETIMYLLLDNLHNCTFNLRHPSCSLFILLLSEGYMCVCVCVYVYIYIYIYIYMYVYINR